MHFSSARELIYKMDCNLITFISNVLYQLYQP